MGRQASDGFANFAEYGKGCRGHKIALTSTIIYFREEMAGVTGLEPAASGVTGQRSNQLSYTPNNVGCGQRYRLA